MIEDPWPSDKDAPFKLPRAEGRLGPPLAELTEDELMENLTFDASTAEDASSVVYALEGFLEAHPASIRAMLKLGSLCALGYGDGVAGAERIFKDILALEPRNTTAMVWLALLQGHPHSSLSADESLDLLRHAVVLSEDPFILRDYANKAWETGRLEQAVAAFTQLKEAPVGPNRDFFSKVAEASMEAIQRGERPATFVYWYPDV
jgi:hypothetical protein